MKIYARILLNKLILNAATNRSFQSWYGRRANRITTDCPRISDKNKILLLLTWQSRTTLESDTGKPWTAYVFNLKWPQKNTTTIQLDNEIQFA